MNKLISEETKYDGRRFNVIQKIYKRPDDLNIVRDCVEPGNAVIILAIFSNAIKAFLLYKTLIIRMEVGVQKRWDNP